MSVSVVGDNYIIKIQNIHSILNFEIKYMHKIDLNVFCITSLNICVIH